MTENPKPPATPRERPCPICGWTDYQWGSAITSYQPPDTHLFFRPAMSTWEDGDMPLNARLCNICGNVQFFYD